MKREFSAGGIVFNDNGEVLLTQHSSNHYWGFPKGNIGQKESSEEAATREVREEAGVEAEISQKVGYSKYVYALGEDKIFKIVTLFLMKYLKGDPRNHDWEVSEARWFEPDEALKTLSFSQDKSLFKEALEMLGRAKGGE